MSFTRDSPASSDDHAAIPLRPRGDGPPPGRPRLKKLRLALIAGGLAILALISALFGVLMAMAAELPRLENRQEFSTARNTVLLGDHGRQIGILTGQEKQVLVGSAQIAPGVKHAIIAVEDKRFYQDSGVDLRGIARATWKDIVHGGAVQGGSTIAEQFVKNALAAEGNRTVFEKVREAALAYHLTHRWSKQKILTEYLNTIYFGHGAYGIESAARTYFASAHPGCGQGGASRPCASVLRPYEAALLAGMVSSPSGYDPLAHPQAARDRRNTVLRLMLEQHYITPSEYHHGIMEALPGRADLHPPQERSIAPYFTSWVKQQMVNRFGATRAFHGGLKVRTTLDRSLQEAATSAVHTYADQPGGPQAALVAIDNRTGEVRAMVGGDDYAHAPFNLATDGRRQPGSSFKPFTLATALTQGISPDSVWPSEERHFHQPGGGTFTVHNFDNEYAGQRTLADGLTYSDNSVYAAVGIKVGVANVARMANRMGIRTKISHNYAVTLGGLTHGVTPLDMAHAYETIADGGRRVWGSLGSPDHGPVGIVSVGEKQGDHEHVIDRNQVQRQRVLAPRVADTMQSIMQTVTERGTAINAAIPGVVTAGKTGTTENFGDAWFVGWTPRYTVAVWVGFPKGNRPMRTEYHGGPVEGGSFPALIWRSFMTQAIQIDASRGIQTQPSSSEATSTTATPAPSPTTSAQPATPAPTSTAPPPAATGTPGDSSSSSGDQTPAPAPSSPPDSLSSSSSDSGSQGTGSSDSGSQTGGSSSSSQGSSPPDHSSHSGASSGAPPSSSSPSTGSGG